MSEEAIMRWLDEDRDERRRVHAANVARTLELLARAVPVVDENQTTLFDDSQPLTTDESSE
jgi:glutamate 5-kinase